MTEIKPTTYQEAAALGGVWVYDWTTSFHGRVVFAGTIEEPQDEYGWGERSDDQYCLLRTVAVLVGAWRGEALDGVWVPQLRRLNIDEQLRLLGDFEDEQRQLERQVSEVQQQRLLVELSDIEDD